MSKQSVAEANARLKRIDPDKYAALGPLIECHGPQANANLPPGIVRAECPSHTLLSSKTEIRPPQCSDCRRLEADREAEEKRRKRDRRRRRRGV